MNSRDLEQALRDLLVNRTSPAAHAVSLDDDLRRSLDLDSLASLRLLALVERQFAVRFPDDQLDTFHTLRRIIALIQSQSPENPS